MRPAPILASVAHDPVRYPLSLERLSSSPEYKTGIIPLGNGGEYRTAWWDDGLLNFNATHGIRTLTDLRTIRSFFRCRKAMARSFLIRDLADYQAVDGSETALMAFATGNGVITDFQLTKTYTDIGNSDVRNITKAEKNTIKIYVNSILKTEGTHYNFLNGYEGSPAIATKDGIIRFTPGNVPANGHILEWSGCFFVPVRFTEDTLPADEIFYNMAPRDSSPGAEWVVREGAGPLPSIPMREVREIA